MCEAEKKTTTECILATVRSAVEPLYGRELDAVILVGSFSRGEEIWYPEQNTVVFLSDIEFLFVARDEGFKKLQGPACAAALRAALQEAGWDIEVSVGVTTKQHLRNFSPYIFPVETRLHGQVVWGDADILRFVPAYTEQDISRLDALILLNNRIVEQLILFTQIEDRDRFNSCAIDKGYVQIINSLLAFEKKYKCLYPDKKYELIQLNISKPGLFNKTGLDITRCLDALERLIKRENVALCQADMTAQWRQLRDVFQNVWLYEISRLLDYEDLNLAQGLKYILSVPDLMSCSRGWAKLFLKKQWRILRAGGRVAKFCFTSPQFLIYRDAARLYFSENSTRQERIDVIDKWQRIVK